MSALPNAIPALTTSGGFLLVLVYGYGAYLPPAPEGSCGPGQPAIEQSAPAPQ